MLELAKLIDLIVGFASPMVQSKLQRSELVIKLLKQLHLDPDHPPADFTAVYQYTLVEYGIGKPKPVLEMFRQAEIQALFRKALDQNHPSLLLQEGETFLSGHSLGDQIQALGIDARQEFYQFAAVFIEVAKRTRTPAEVLSNQRLESLHRQIGSMQERLHRLPTLEAMRTEMARLAAQRSESVGEWMSGRVDESTHRPIDPSTPPLTPSSIFALAQQMKGWFETLGYRFESYEVWQDDYFEWIIDIPVRRGRYDRILVRGIDGEVGLIDIKALRQSVETQRADEGWLVTARRISRAAREAVEQEANHDLGCYTFDELLDQDADFGGYLDWLEAEIGRRGIDQKYVPLACTKEEMDPDTKQRLGVSRYDDRDGWIDGYIDLWLDDPAKEHISVLGEFGTGKTWFAFHYASQALKRYREAQQRGVERPRLPLVIPLRDYAKAVSVESLFSEFFFRKHEVRSLTYSAFEQLNRMGKLLLIFDGFDEMAARVDRQEMINNFWELAKVVVPGAKVILTCRTEHFPEAREGRALLNAQLQASTASLTGEMPQFEVLELEKFNDAQIREVMLLQAESATVEQVMSNPQLLDLARRPVMTELILEALPDIEAGKPVDMSRVYLYAVRRKMERDIKEERTFTSLAEKLYFLCELSWEMLSSDRMSLNYREFPDRIRRLFGSVVQEEKDLDHWHYDMMGQTMLIRNADGDYMPAHRSLLEFFVAYKFAAELGALAPDFLELAQMQSCLDTSAEPQDYTWSGYFQRTLDETGRSAVIAPLSRFVSEDLARLQKSVGMAPLSKAVIDLLLPMLVPFHSSTHPLLQSLQAIRHKTEAEVSFVGGNMATLLAKLDKAALENANLSHTVLNGASFINASLRNVNFTNASLHNCTFAEAFASVWSVLVSPDGNLLATAHVSGEIRIWLLSNSNPILTCKGHTSGINSIAFSPNSKNLVSTGDDRTIRIWDVSIGQCLKILRDHVGLVRAAVFSSDGQIVASGSDDNSVKLWDAHTGKCLRSLQGHTGSVRSIAITPDNQIVVSGSDDHSIRLWDIRTGKCLRKLQGHTSSVRSIAITPDGKTIASGSSDNTVRLWDTRTAQHLQTFQEHTERVRSVAFSSDGQTLASGSFDNTIKLWDIQSRQCIRTIEGHTNWLRSVAFDPNNQMLISSSDDQTVKFWCIRTGKCLKTLQGQTSWILSVCFSSDCRTLISSDDENTIKVWDVATGRCLRTLQGHSNWVASVALSHDDQIIASGSEDQTIKLWNMRTGQCLKTLQGHDNIVRTVTFSPDGQTLASSSDDQTIKLWNPSTGVCLNTLKGELSRVCSIAFSPDGRFLASGGSDRKVRLWDASTGHCLKVWNGHSDWVMSVNFSSHGELLASGGGDGTVRLWKINDDKYSRVFQGHTAWIWSISFSPCGDLLASCSSDKTIRLWRVSTKECWKVIYGHENWINSVSFSSDGQLLASGSNDETIRLWNGKTGEWLKTLVDRPYEGMNITSVKGLTEAEKATLKALGAVEDEE